MFEGQGPTSGLPWWWACDFVPQAQAGDPGCLRASSSNVAKLEVSGEHQLKTSPKLSYHLHSDIQVAQVAQRDSEVTVNLNVLERHLS